MLTKTFDYLLDKLGFWRIFLRNPKQVSAVVPSGSALADLMTSEIGPAHAPVIELGPGTGVFTHRLIGRGVPEKELVLVESASEFAARLEAEFPDATILQIDAARLGEVGLPNGRDAGAVVSGLPLLSMSDDAIERIMRAAFAQLRGDGVFYQFTYGPGCPVPSHVLERLELQAESIGWVPANLPPASVYCIARSQEGVA